MTEDRSAGPAEAGAPRTVARPVRCVVVGGSLVGLSAAIALSRLGFEVTVAERSPARAVDGGGGLGVDVALLRDVTGIDADPPVLKGSTVTAPRGTCCRAGSRRPGTPRTRPARWSAAGSGRACTTYRP